MTKASALATALTSLLLFILLQIQLSSVAGHNSFFFDRFKDEKKNMHADSNARTSFPGLVGLTGDEAKQLILKERSDVKVHIIPKVSLWFD